VVACQAARVNCSNRDGLKTSRWLKQAEVLVYDADGCILSKSISGFTSRDQVGDMVGGQMYLHWLKQLPTSDGEYPSARCPSCGSTGLSFKYFGPASGEYGWKVVWCETCWSGINVSRIKLPGSQSIVRSEDGCKDFEATLKRIRLVLD